ncbi:MAG: hypothetical protein HUU55_16335 [Myxococcales bacterium]|nr:hypothetical protein [Myxococcales bacterium]
MSGHFLDTTAWERHALFRFFLSYEVPTFNLCADVDVTETVEYCRSEGHSFSMVCWYFCQLAVNSLEPFRYRLRGDQVWVWDRIRVSTTILNPDETFRFCHFPYAEHFPEFVAGAKAAISAQPTDVMDDRPDDDGVIHGSTVPWLRFTSVSHARRTVRGDSIPKIVLGRYGATSNRLTMPVSVEAHHALMDGIVAARFYKHLESYFTNVTTKIPPDVVLI